MINGPDDFMIVLIVGLTVIFFTMLAAIIMLP